MARTNNVTSPDVFKPLFALQQEVDKAPKACQMSAIKPRLEKLYSNIAQIDGPVVISEETQSKVEKAFASLKKWGAIKGRTFKASVLKKEIKQLTAKIDDLSKCILEGKALPKKSKASSSSRRQPSSTSRTQKESTTRVRVVSSLSLTENGRIDKELAELSQLKEDVKTITKDNAKTLCLSYQFKLAYTKLLEKHNIALSDDQRVQFSDSLNSIEASLKAHDDSKDLLETVIPHGIVNGGNDCCFISLTQALNWGFGSDFLNAMPNFFASFISNYNNLSQGKNIRACVNEFCSPENSRIFSESGQEDASEIFMHIFEAMQKEDIEPREEGFEEITIHPKKPLSSLQKKATTLFESLQEIPSTAKKYRLKKNEKEKLCREGTELYKTGIVKTSDGKKIHANTFCFEEEGPVYIAAQTPTEDEEALRNFWEVASQDSNSFIIDLSHEEDGLTPYYPEKLKESITYKDLTITYTATANVSESITANEYTCKDASGKETMITRLHCNNFQKDKVIDPKNLSKLLEAIQTYSRGKTPIIHSLNGTGRVGTVITALAMKHAENKLKGHVEEKVLEIIKKGQKVKDSDFISSKQQIYSLLNFGKLLTEGSAETLPATQPNNAVAPLTNVRREPFFKAAIRWMFQGVVDMLVNIITFIDKHIVKIEGLHSDRPSPMRNLLQRSRDPNAPQAPRKIRRLKVSVPDKNPDRPNADAVRDLLEKTLSTQFSVNIFDVENLPDHLKSLDEVGGEVNTRKTQEGLAAPLAVPLKDSDQPESLESLLKHYSSEEERDEPLILNVGDETFEVPQKGYNQISKAPEKLVIQLKRFTFDRKSGDSHKIDTEVDGIKDTFVAPKELFEDNQAANYELSAFVYHVGTSARSGHYTAYIKVKTEDQDQWYLCNDNDVSPVTKEQALDAAKRAYILVGSKK